MSVADGRADRTDRLSVLDGGDSGVQGRAGDSDNVGPTAVRRKVDANTGVHWIAVDMRSEVDLYEVPGLELRPVGRGGAVVRGDLVATGLRRKRRQRPCVADAGLDPFLEFPEQHARPNLGGCPVPTVGGYAPRLPISCQFVNVHYAK